MGNPLTRRRLLRHWLGASIGLGGSALLAACGRGTATTSSSTAVSAQTGSSSAVSVPTRVPSVLTGTSSAASTAGATAPPAKTVPVTWTTWANTSWNAWEKDIAIPTFQRLNPGISIDWVNVKQTDLDTKLQTLYAGGTPADVWVPYNRLSARGYAALGMLRDLTPLIQRDKIDLTVFPQPVRDLFTIDGHVIAMPYSVYGSFLFYNKDLFERAGVPTPTANWDDQSWTVQAMAATARKLTRAAGQADAQYGINGNGCSMSQGIEGWLWAADPWAVDGYASGYPSTCSFTSAGAETAYSFFADLMYKDKVAPSAADVKALGLAANQNPFLAQRQAMQITGGFALVNYKQNVKFKLGIAAFPRAKANTNPIWPDSYLMGAKAKYPDQAWSLLRYLSSAEGVRAEMAATGAPPANQQLLDQWYASYSLLPTAGMKQAFEGALRYGKPPLSHAFVDSLHLRSLFDPTLNTLWDGTAAVSAALQNTQSVVTAALAPNAGKRVCVTGSATGAC